MPRPPVLNGRKQTSRTKHESNRGLRKSAMPQKKPIVKMSPFILESLQDWVSKLGADVVYVA